MKRREATYDNTPSQFSPDSRVFNLFTKKLQEIVKKRFKEPTLVQKLAMPIILSGKSALIIAPTGVGKTESCMLPIFDEWLRTHPKPISILYITPLRSLNRDLLKRFLWWANELDIDVSVRHGDTSSYARRMQVEVPPDLLITTPETLQAILPAKRMKEHLRNVRFVIVDEVHELASSKRGTQLTVALERLRELCGDFQLIALSATLGQPRKIAEFIAGGREMEIVRAVEMKEMKIEVINPEPTTRDSKLAEKLSSDEEIAARLRVVSNLIKEHTSTLTFTNTRDFAEVLTSRLKQAFPSLKVENHHSSLSKEIRIRVENDFKAQKLKGIICTSSLELGIDIGSVDFVIQYMSPRQVSRIIQRVGRSGHRLERVSEGVIITTDEDDIFESAVIARKALNGELEPLTIHENALDVLAHQIIGITRDKKRASLDEIFRIIKRAYPFRKLQKKDFLEVCKFMESLRFIFVDEKLRVGRKGLLYYFENLSTIPDTKSYSVIDVTTNTRVGSLDEEFVALHAQEGVDFIIKGEPWRIISIEENKIYVEPSSEREAAIPGWEGELIPVPFEVAQEVGRLRGFIERELKKKMREEDLIEKIRNSYPVDESSAKKMIKLISKQLKYGVVPTDKKILVETHENFIILHTCLGSKGNETLGRLLSSLLANRIGSVALKTDPYRIILQIQVKNLNLLKDILLKTKPEFIEAFIDLTLPNSKIFEWKFIHVAKRFGVIKKDADYGRSLLRKIIDLYRKTPVWRETLREIKTDKLDVECVKEFLKRLQRKEIELVFRRGLSPLGRLGLKERFELLGPERPETEILDIFIKRLMEKRVMLICLNCGEWMRTFKVKDLPEEIRCEKCGAKLIGVGRPGQLELQRIVRKKVKGTSLSLEEARKLKKLERTSDIVIVYQKRGVIALATRGVGPENAMRILRGMYEDERDFFKALLKAERQFIRTKKFWG